MLWICTSLDIQFVNADSRAGISLGKYGPKALGVCGPHQFRRQGKVEKR